MTDDEALAAIRWIDSIDLATADAETCERALLVVDALQTRLDDVIGELAMHLRRPLCSIHCHAPLHSMRS